MQDDLKSWLDSWQPEVPETTDFQRNVWQRIERQRKARSWLALTIEWMGQPRIAAGLIAVAILLGAVAGSGISSNTQTQNYLRSVNPYAQTR